MRLSLVSQLLLVFISVLALTRAQTNSEPTALAGAISPTTPAPTTPAPTTSPSTTPAPTTPAPTTPAPTTPAPTTPAPTTPAPTTPAPTTPAPTTPAPTASPSTTPAPTTPAPTTPAPTTPAPTTPAPTTPAPTTPAPTTPAPTTPAPTASPSTTPAPTTPPSTTSPSTTSPSTTTTSTTSPSTTSPSTTTTSTTSPSTTTTSTTLAAPGIFYLFGSAKGDTINPADDDGYSTVIPLLSPFLFFGRTYSQIYVNNNGHLTFNQPSSQFVPYSFPANGSQDIIAGLWTDLDNRARGVVSYHQYTNGSVLTRATQDINNHFPNLAFSASWVFVATWDKDPYFPSTNTEASFQVVLISGSSFSFILMNYGDIAVTGHPVEAGYDTVNSTDYFVIPGSNSGSLISNLKNSSNVNLPGRWAFRVDGGHNTSTNNIIGLQMKLSSFSDLTQSGNIEIVLQQIKQELIKNGLQSNIELKIRKVQKIKP